MSMFNHIAINAAEGRYFFHPDEITRLEACSNYTYIHFTNRKPMIIAKVLAEYESMLSSMGFIRTHRSHLVNTKYIRFINPNGVIIMQDTSTAEVSRRKKKDVMKFLKDYCFINKAAA